MIKVLFVCLGNICRSPTAEGVFRFWVKKYKLEHAFEIDSAGTSGYHQGEAPDRRSQMAAAKRGYSLVGQTSRQITQTDFEYFDYILAMDKQNLKDLSRICPNQHHYKLQLFLSFIPQGKMLEVPDPYYGGEQGFNRVIDLVEQASQGFLADIEAKK